MTPKDVQPGSRLVPVLRRVAARASRHLGPLVVYIAVACAMLAPYAGDRLRESTASDLSVHCSGIIEACNALAEGQFPVRVAPSHNGGHGGTDFGGVRYPLFQFYGQFPYTAGGLLCFLLGLDAFTAWKLVQIAALTVGGFYAYRCGVAATRRPRAALVAGVVFMTAPYMWADLHARFAYPEFVSFNLLPVVTFYSQRAFATRRRWGCVLLGGVAWSLLALSHNVTFLYASAFLGLYFASHLAITRRFFSRVSRVGIAYALGITLTLWFHVPQYYMVPLVNIRIQGDNPRPVGAEQLTPLNVLLSPTLKSPPGSPTERLGLQVGWPVLGAAGLAVGWLIWGERRARRRNRVVVVVRLLAFLAVAFVLVWSPPPVGGFDVWRVLPKVFAYVQSSYRILMFVTLFGALLVPYALRAIPLGRDLPAWVTLLLLAAVAWSAMSYVPRHERLPSDALAKLVAHPILDGLRDYLIDPAEVARTSRSHPGVNWAEPIHGVVPREGKLEGAWRSLVPVPQPAPRSLVIEGFVPSDAAGPVVLNVVLDGTLLGSLDVPPGAFRRELAIERVLTSSVVPLELSTTRSPVYVTGLQLSGVTEQDFVPAQQALAGTRKGARTLYAGELVRPSLAQLPVLFYPRLLRVRVDGAEVEYGNVGRFVALDLPAGTREVEVEFVGVRWANVISAGAWAGVLVGLAVAAVRGFRRYPRALSASRRPPAGARAGQRRGIRWWESAFAAALLFAMIGAAPVREVVDRAHYVPLACTATASRPGDDLHPPSHAFDGDETTFWFVPGGTPATLTIVPREADKFRRITLLARRSGLWEAWRKVRVVLYLRGEVVLEKDFDLETPDAEPEQVIRFPSTRANRIELHFSDPVTLTRDGKTRVDPNGVSPGYREIRIE